MLVLSVIDHPVCLTVVRSLYQSLAVRYQFLRSVSFPCPSAGSRLEDTSTSLLGSSVCTHAGLTDALHTSRVRHTHTHTHIDMKAVSLMSAHHLFVSLTAVLSVSGGVLSPSAGGAGKGFPDPSTPAHRTRDAAHQDHQGELRFLLTPY